MRVLSAWARADRFNGIHHELLGGRQLARLAQDVDEFAMSGRVAGSDSTNTQDLLRLVQLLNGVNTTQSFNGAGVTACPG